MNVLDNGYVRVVETWGEDKTIIESARMSTNKGFEGWEKDESLLRYLYTNGHTTPFEMCGATFEIYAPIVVFREWHRHRTQSYSEMSARYVPLPNENYLPEFSNVLERAKAARDSKNRQATSEFEVDEQGITMWLSKLDYLYKQCQIVYEAGLRAGVPKELARLSVPVARYSRMRATANLRNWLHFLELRQAPNAQWEIRQYADIVAFYLTNAFPRTMALFEEAKDAARTPT